MEMAPAYQHKGGKETDYADVPRLNLTIVSQYGGSALGYAKCFFFYNSAIFTCAEFLSLGVL